MDDPPGRRVLVSRRAAGVVVLTNSEPDEIATVTENLAAAVLPVPAAGRPAHRGRVIPRRQELGSRSCVSLLTFPDSGLAIAAARLRCDSVSAIGNEVHRRTL